MLATLRHHTTSALPGAAACCALLSAGYLLRHLNIVFNPILWTSSQIIAVVLSFTIAANVLVRYRGTGDRVPLLLGLGFTLGAFIQVGGIIEFHRHFERMGALQLHVPISWMIGRTVLAVLLCAVFAVEKQLRWPRDARMDVAAAFSIVAAIAFLVTLAFLASSQEPRIHPGSPIPRPWDLLPAVLFLCASATLKHTPGRDRSAFNSSLVWFAYTNAACHLVASQSAQLLDAAAIASQVLENGSYALLLGATLLDNLHLFGQVRHRATTDSLTGLANYRRFIDALENEFERWGRTGRSFSVLLMDLDGLKEINDRYGHLTGTRAICRVADVLRLHCRVIDTAARYGGDEFALLLPETQQDAARHVADRICRHLAADTEMPRLSLSIGVATHPQSGMSSHQLLDAADRALYANKTHSKFHRSGSLPQ